VNCDTEIVFVSVLLVAPFRSKTGWSSKFPDCSVLGRRKWNCAEPRKEYNICRITSQKFNKVDIKMKKQVMSKLLICTACPKRTVAELLHPVLHVPICGPCNAQIKDADRTVVDNQILICVWCGNDNDANLMMCDTCVNSFCFDCVSRNFGNTEAVRVKRLDVWSCFTCAPTPKFLTLQVQEDTLYFNIDKVYAQLHPPSVREVYEKSERLWSGLSAQEKVFASLLANCIGTTQIHDSNLITSYLTGVDTAVLPCLSKGLRRYFQTKIALLPGLFQTPYGKDNLCKLHDHQIVSLNSMLQIENRTTEFGDLRGGIFGDEPGLGKTVTTLALIAATAGAKPQQPAVFWNRESIEEHWQMMRGQYEGLLTPVLNRLQKCPAVGRFVLPGFLQLRRKIDAYCTSMEAFESEGNERFLLPLK
jgi:hypothetical protein